MGLGTILKQQQSKGGAFAKRASLIKKKKYVSFDELVARLMKTKGYSKERARKIAAAAGRKTYGKRGMQELASYGKTAAGKRFKVAKK